MGGPGTERAVSLRSGGAVADALRMCGAEVEEMAIDDTNIKIPQGTFLVFNMIHGTFGEDGQLQSLLDAAGVPYTGDGVEASRAAFDKILTKQRFDAAGIPTAAWETAARDRHPKLRPPFVLKAPRQGSSVGIHIVLDESETAAALDDCLRYDSEILVEAFTPGRELTVGVLGDLALPIIEIVPNDGFYDYEHKYTKGASEYFVPAEIGPAATATVQEAALAAHRALGLEVYSRVDVILGPDGALNVMEANTIPGMTETSLLPKAAGAVGISFPELCLRIAALSLRRFGKGGS